MTSSHTLSEKLLHDVITPGPAQGQDSGRIADVGRFDGNLERESEKGQHVRQQGLERERG